MIASGHTSPIHPTRTQNPSVTCSSCNRIAETSHSRDADKPDHESHHTHTEMCNWRCSAPLACTCHSGSAHCHNRTSQRCSTAGTNHSLNIHHRSTADWHIWFHPSTTATHCTRKHHSDCHHRNTTDHRSVAAMHRTRHCSCSCPDAHRQQIK